MPCYATKLCGRFAGFGAPSHGAWGSESRVPSILADRAPRVVDMRVIRNIISSWFLTVPLTATIAMIFFWILRFLCPANLG